MDVITEIEKEREGVPSAVPNVRSFLPVRSISGKKDHLWSGYSKGGAQRGPSRSFEIVRAMQSPQDGRERSLSGGIGRQEYGLHGPSRKAEGKGFLADLRWGVNEL